MFMKNKINSSTIYSKTIKSPIGTLTLVSTMSSLLAIDWGTNNRHHVGCCQILEDSESQLNEYFSGKRRVFELPFDLQGTKFQKRVWNELRKIPFGQTRTYKEIAQSIGSSGAFRAVGMACSQNPLPIVVPCR